MFMVLSSWQSHCESSPGSFDECRMAPSGRRPKTKPDDLGCQSACTGCQSLHPAIVNLTLNNIVTLKSGLEVTQRHSNWYHSKAWVWFPIRLP